MRGDVERGESVYYKYIIFFSLHCSLAIQLGRCAEQEWCANRSRGNQWHGSGPELNTNALIASKSIHTLLLLWLPAISEKGRDGEVRRKLHKKYSGTFLNRPLTCNPSSSMCLYTRCKYVIRLQCNALFDSDASQKEQSGALESDWQIAWKRQQSCILTVLHLMY